MSEHGRPPSSDQPPQRHAPQGRPPFADDASYPDGPSWPGPPPPDPATWPAEPYQHSAQPGWTSPSQGGAQPDPYRYDQSRPAAYGQDADQQGTHSQGTSSQGGYQQPPYQQASYRGGGSYQEGWSYQPPPPGQPSDPPGLTPMPPSPHQPGYSLSSDQFRPPTSRTPLLVTVIVVAVVLAVVATGAFVAWRSDHPAAAPSPSQTTSVPIPSSSGNSIQFVSDTGSGTLAILDTRWSADALLVKIKLSCSDGQVQHGTFNFKAFDVNGTLYDSSIEGVPNPPMSEGTIYQGESITGWLEFGVPRQDMTLLLISEYGDAITAFAIKG